MSAPTSKAAAGDAQRPPDFATIYDRHFAMVWRVARDARVPRSHLEDVVQETFVVIHRKLQSFEGRSSLRTWIAAITRNTAKEFLRRRRHELLGGEIDPDAAASKSMTPAERLEASAGVRLLDKFLGGMPKEQRDVFVLAEMEQMTTDEIASALRSNPNTVRTRLRAARKAYESLVRTPIDKLPD